MKYSEQLSKLVIDNIEQHERAAQVLEEIDRTIIKAIELEVKTILKSGAPTLSCNENFDFYRDDSMTFSFNDWKVSNLSDSAFFAEIDYSSDKDDIETATYLGLMCGIPNQGTGLRIRFYADYKALGLKANRYKQLLREALEASQRLIKNGFRLSSTGYELEYTCQLNKDCILAHFPNDLSEAIAPLTTSLETFIDCKSEFDVVMKKLNNP